MMMSDAWRYLFARNNANASQYYMEVVLASSQEVVHHILLSFGMFGTS